MSLRTHLETLEAKHAQLEAQIHDAHTHHQPTNALKKHKLLVKEEIEQLRRSNDNAEAFKQVS